MVGVLHNIFVN